MNTKRDLFQAAILQNGNMDLINDLPHKSQIWAKQHEYLTNRHDFECIKRYAPLLHIHSPHSSEESYPTTLIVASKNDQTVCITNSLKYLAHRREKFKHNDFQAQKPILMKVIKSGGHNYRTATRKDFIDAVFVKLQFLAEAMELKCDEKYQLILPTVDAQDEIEKGLLSDIKKQHQIDLR